jgi:regulator of protease activity HflC (stomatin/prohibitin superfamily)
MTFLITMLVTFFAAFIAVPILLALARAFCFYAVISERQCVVFELFGKVRWVADEPGLHFPWMHMGPFAALVPFFGHRRFVDLRVDQTYLRSQPVNSEEGAPMGIGVWYEMYVTDPLAYLYKNSDPSGSLRANVSTATVRCLSNMKLERMLEDRHEMSQAVREEVTAQSKEWGYETGSVYVRKVHFRDEGMIAQIEQDGSNRVNVIRSAAEREAATEFAKAAAMRPQIVGSALSAVARDKELCDALFDVLETQNLMQNQKLIVTLMPKYAQLLGELEASRGLHTGK